MTRIMSYMLVLLLTLLTANAGEAPINIPTLSYETTRISEPLNDDGTVNYLAAINAQYSKGVTAQNNAAILLLQAAGPEILPPIIKDKLLAIFGMSALPSEGDYLVRFNTDAEDSEEAYEVPEEALDAPWSAEDYPQLADWLKANEKPLSLVTAASKRSRYYMPMLSSNESSLIVSVLVPILSTHREISRALVSRAMLKLDSGDIEGAQADLLAVHRLARLVGQGPTLIDRLVGMAAESTACKGDNALATSNLLSSSQARTYLAKLQALPALPSVTEAMDVCERFSLLDNTTYISRTDYKKQLLALLEMNLVDKRLFEANTQIDLSKIEKEKALQILEMPVDWNEILKRMNAWYDRMLDAAGKATFAQRMKAFEQISSELKALGNNATEQLRQLLLTEEKANATQAFGSLLIAIWAPDLSGAVPMYNVTTMKLQASQVAMALAAYRAEHSRYPESLSKLCPKYFKTVPDDLFTAKPLDYRRTEKGYVLYSPGPTKYEKFKDTPQEIEIIADK